MWVATWSCMLQYNFAYKDTSIKSHEIAYSLDVTFKGQLTSQSTLDSFQ